MTSRTAGDTLTDLAARCLDVLRDRGQTLGTAESITAGLVSSTLARVPGASDVLRGGLAAYAEDVKVSVLGVDPGVFARDGVYSAGCAAEMARAALTCFDVDWAVSTTGVAGPDPQDGHPAGEVYVGVATAHRPDVTADRPDATADRPDATADPSDPTRPELTRTQRLDLGGERNAIRAASVEAALTLLEAALADTA